MSNRKKVKLERVKRLPDVELCRQMVLYNGADPVEIFIYNHEPTNLDERIMFRKNLIDLINYVRQNNVRGI